MPRFHGSFSAALRNFRRHDNGPLIDGKRVRYSVAERNRNTINLLDENFDLVRSANSLLTSTDHHDFLFTDQGNFLFISHEPETRDFSDFNDAQGNPLPESMKVRDSVIQEVAPDAAEADFTWNSWDHMKLDPDCRVWRFSEDYAHLNSLQIVDGDIVASFFGCAQILRIDRETSSGEPGTGAIEWKLGGTSPTRDPGTVLLEIVGDTTGEFCGQHQPTVTDSGHIVLFDNGVHCLGTRKLLAPFTRVVEYDLSSGTQASFVREYRRPAGHGHSVAAGGVTLLDNGHWLIAWGRTSSETADRQEIIAVSEYDPNTGTSVLEMNMSSSKGLYFTYRVYRESEADVQIPLNLP